MPDGRDNGDGPADTIKSYETLGKIVDVLQEWDGAKVTELANHIGMAKSSTYRHLKTLEENDYVVKEGTTYHLGLRFLDLGGHVRNTQDAYYQIRPKVHQIAEETGELCRFTAAEHGYGVVVHREWGSNAVWTDGRVGKRYRLHQTAGGKAILATYSEEETERIIDQYGLEARTEHTITSKDELITDLETMSSHGCTFDMGEHLEKLWAVGVPVTVERDRVVGGLSVLGPEHRMQGEWFKQELPDMLRGVVDEIELNIQFATTEPSD